MFRIAYQSSTNKEKIYSSRECGYAIKRCSTKSAISTQYAIIDGVSGNIPSTNANNIESGTATTAKAVRSQPGMANIVNAITVAVNVGNNKHSVTHARDIAVGVVHRKAHIALVGLDLPEGIAELFLERFYPRNGGSGRCRPNR